MKNSLVALICLLVGCVMGWFGRDIAPGRETALAKSAELEEIEKVGAWLAKLEAEEISNVVAEIPNRELSLVLDALLERLILRQSENDCLRVEELMEEWLKRSPGESLAWARGKGCATRREIALVIVAAAVSNSDEGEAFPIFCEVERQSVYWVWVRHRSFVAKYLSEKADVGPQALSEALAKGPRRGDPFEVGFVLEPIRVSFPPNFDFESFGQKRAELYAAECSDKETLAFDVKFFEHWLKRDPKNALNHAGERARAGEVLNFDELVSGLTERYSKVEAIDMAWESLIGAPLNILQEIIIGSRSHWALVLGRYTRERQIEFWRGGGSLMPIVGQRTEFLGKVENEF